MICISLAFRRIGLGILTPALLFFGKISFYPMPDTTFLKISGVKLDELVKSHLRTTLSIFG